VKWPFASSLIVVLGIVGVTDTARAESCTKSRDFILTNSSDLPQKAKVYQGLFRDCLDTIPLSNVQDAFVLKVGAIAVLPRLDTIPATASTLAQFCERFPRGTLHFLGKKERAQAANVARVVDWSSPRSTSCQRIKGGG
jgi:hypothetical protein